MSSDDVAASASLISTLAPPPQSSRPSSSTSNRSGSSRRGRSPNSRGPNILSRSNSDSSRSHKAGEGRKESRDTVTIGGGTSLGPKDRGNVPKKRTPKDKDDPKKPVDSAAQGRGQNRRSSTNAIRRPDPIHIARPSSQTSNPVPNQRDTSQPASAPRSITASVSAPRTAMDAAVDAATQKHNALSGGDALASLQKMISDLKAISPSSVTPAPSSGDSVPGSRTASGTKETPAQAKPTGIGPAASSPLIIPGARSKKLKADAPSFTPSLQPSSVSPVGSQPSVSPGSVNAPLWPAQPRSTSHGSVRRASSSSTGNGSLSSYGSMPNVAVASLPPYPNASPHFSLANINAYQSHLHVHPEADNEDLSPLSYVQQSESQYQQQQILAAQQLQYQQLQLLQAQIAATQLSQQHQHQHQQQQSMGSFVAPRFQALAAQRAAQQQQQAQQLVHAQQLYEIQQQQLLEAQRRQEQSALSTAQAVLSNPSAVFEEDSPEPEPKVALLGPTGRPQLAPTFTFGAKARSESDRDTSSAPSQPLLINRSEGIGGAEATGLAGLAARAHKRTGSEMTPAMQQQVSDLSRSRLIF